MNKNQATIIAKQMDDLFNQITTANTNKNADSNKDNLIIACILRKK